MRGINIEYFEGILREEDLFVFNLAQDKKIRFFFLSDASPPFRIFLQRP
jgi:hypothetical protein